MLVEEIVKVVFAGRREERVVPRELLAFLNCVSGVSSLDLDRRGLCPFEAPVKKGASREEGRDTLVCNNECPPEVVQDPKGMSGDLFEEHILSRLDVLGGFEFGWNTGVWQSQPIEQWHSHYLFCRHKPDDDDEDDDDPADNTDKLQTTPIRTRTTRIKQNGVGVWSYISRATATKASFSKLEFSSPSSNSWNGTVIGTAVWNLRIFSSIWSRIMNLANKVIVDIRSSCLDSVCLTAMRALA